MKDIKVLIADDEEEILSILSKKVAAEGFNVVTADDGLDAWNKIQKEEPDVVVLDLTMPQMDGLEVLKNLRENPTSKKWQPVIIVSARAELEDMQKGYSMEADHYISKPCSAGDIIKGIRQMVSLSTHRQNNKAK